MSTERWTLSIEVSEQDYQDIAAGLLSIGRRDLCARVIDRRVAEWAERHGAALASDDEH